ncbi:DNA starvation/stationary phase protection protein [Actinopolymorpha rutila]|uniref:Starvation-inducible DNA-binding protein n=1 Tax=Actinopolymorpha rutila TaxID=446787 RepID=A0A852ZWL8_9ACTN|nr:starvation-inducible DNA-binding protein [Actinopolymorpha rutila]
MTQGHAKITSEVSGKDVAKVLQPVLVDLVGLALNGKQLHWHVRGRYFLPVHERLDAVIDDAREFADTVAERLVALDVLADGRPATVATTTNLPEVAPGFTSDDKVVGAVVDQLDATIARARAAMEALETTDTVSQDIVIEALRALEKHRWMFAAQLG